MKKISTYLLALTMVLLSFSSAFAAPTVLKAPNDLVAIGGDSQINLTWSQVQHATYYNVYGSLDGLNYNLISDPTTVTEATYDVSGLTNSKLYYFKTSAVNTDEESTYSNVVTVKPSVGSAAVNLGTAGDYAILTKTGISTVPNSVITGNIGVSPIDSTAITGFSLTVDATNEFSGSTQVTGKAFAADYASPTPSKLTTSISNMETAYTDAAGRAADFTELYTGDISGQTLTPGVYKWGTGVLINSDVYLNGGADDVFIFQIAKGITQASNTKIILTGGVQAKNIFWQSAQTVEIGTGAHFEGIVLGKTNISMGNKASINGRLLAQTAVTLIKSTVVAPSNEPETHNYSIDINGNDAIELGQSANYLSHVYDNGVEVLDKSIQWNVKNQDNSTPVMASFTSIIGNAVTVKTYSESSYVNKYVVLSGTLTDNQSITIEKLVQIKSLQ
ncbi:ice-binding family protein [Clostridium sp.]|jgi:hypothetical protein|uniref:ice-binding family protein n=1 Tax=Clostridium sp. TaxID=1506 RepID=UPI003EEFA3F4